MKASFPLGIRILFQFASQTRRASSADCRLGTGCVSIAVFAAAKMSGKVRRCGGVIVRPARFAAAKRRSPAGFATQHSGRPIAKQSRSRSGQEKESGDHRGELARIRGIHSLFRIACRNKSTQRRFSGELERCFYPKSSLSNASSSQYGTGTNFPSNISFSISSREAARLSQVSPSCKITLSKSKSHSNSQTSL